MTYEEALRKALACLRLAERGGTKEEAASAAAKAQEIITKYQIDISDVDFDAERLKEDAEPIKNFGYEDPLDCPTASEFSREMFSLAQTVAYFNQCVVAYRKTEKAYSFQFRIVGRATNVSTVRYLYGFYKHQIIEIMKAATRGNSRTYKEQFVMGCIDAIQAKLAVQEKETFAKARGDQAGNPLALVRVNNAVARIEKMRVDVHAAFNDTKKSYGTARGGFAGTGTRTTTGGRSHGQREGKKIRTTQAGAAIGGGRKEIGQ